MEQFGNEIKKVLKAGLGAVTAGMDKAQEAIDSLAEKGEPFYQQAKSAVVDAADKMKQAYEKSGIAEVFSCHPKAETVIEDLRELTQEELDEVRQALEEIYPTRPRRREATPDQAPEACPPEDCCPEDATENPPEDAAPEADESGVPSQDDPE